MLSKTFTGSTRAEAVMKADKWWAAQSGLFKSTEWKTTVGEGRQASVDQPWSVTIVYESKSN